jgi:tRNA threonylcarbamoyladenosine biosynthesis protein TsaE
VELTIRTSTADDTREVAAEVGRLLRPHDVVVLTGELGAGKTTFVQGVARGVGATEHVASPTFTLVREYVSGDVPLAHVDLYRLDRQQDVIDLALEVAELLSPERLRIELTVVDPNGEDDARLIVVETVGPSWEERAAALASTLGRWAA